MIYIPKCPYCNNDIVFKVSINQVAIDDEYKDAVREASEIFLDIQSNIMPIGGKMARRLAQKSINNYFEIVTALPVSVLSCESCDKIINAELIKQNSFI